MVFWCSLTSVDTFDGLDSNGGSDVNVTDQGCHTDVEPVFIKRSELFVDGCLNNIRPFWLLDFAGPVNNDRLALVKWDQILVFSLFEESGQSPDEFVLIDVFNRDRLHLKWYHEKKPISIDNLHDRSHGRHFQYSTTKYAKFLTFQTEKNGKYLLRQFSS